MRKLLLLFITSLAFSTVTDIDDNVYETVLIDNQLWMAENLKVTQYSNGDVIYTGATLPEDNWSNTTQGAYSVYDSNPDYGEIYGYLYNWFSINDDRGICPENWHIPSDNEFMLLLYFISDSLKLTLCGY